MKILIAGDFSPKFNLNKLIREQKVNPFEEIKKLTKQNDFSIINFETTVACNEKPIKKCGPNLSCDKEAVLLLKKAGFSIANLANNHSFDYGEKGLVNTIKILEENNFKIIGAGANLAEAQKPLYLKHDDKTLAIISCCEHEFSIATTDSWGANPINPISQFYTINEARKKSDYVIILTHGGHEHYQFPSTEMQDLFRFYIDVGADAVINCHQHCFSGYEVYNEKPIFYGMGNFFFNRKKLGGKNQWNEGYIVELDFDKKVNFKIYPYIQCVNDYIVELLKDNSEFNKKISVINNIISERKLLEESNKKFYLQKSREFLSLFYPIQNRYFKYAYRKKLLPNLLKEKTLRSILNHVDCESHRSILLNILKDKTK